MKRYIDISKSSSVNTNEFPRKRVIETWEPVRSTLAVNFKMAAARLLVVSRKCIAVEGLYQQKVFQREIKN